MASSIVLLAVLAAGTRIINAVQATSLARGNIVDLQVPNAVSGASIEQSPSFSSFSFEPAFWEEFFGNLTSPNRLTFAALSTIHEHGGRPNIRPGGITMDSMIFNGSASGVIRTTNSDGGVYRTTVGPSYYESWSSFPTGTRFVSTLNFGNNSLPIARDLALASVRYQVSKIKYFELGNEPNNYASAGTRWNDSTLEYVEQWKNWTAQIDAAVNETLGRREADELGGERWWASSATTDPTTLQVRPVDIIPAGVDSADQVAQYSIHSYAFATCDPARAALATIPNILNHTGLVSYAEDEIMPSAKAALDAGSQWIVGEFNSIACSGNPGVSDTFAQALWQVDTELIYASRNASACYLHQGATLVFQSSDQVNSAGANGTPSYSTYSILYPTNSSARGPARVNPAFVGTLFLAEAFAEANTRVRSLETPAGINSDGFASYAFYNGAKLSKLALLNLKPYYGNTTNDYTATFRIDDNLNGVSNNRGTLKRMTAPAVNEKNSDVVTWAGQSFKEGIASGEIEVEKLGGTVAVRGSEAVLISFD